MGLLCRADRAAPGPPRTHIARESLQWGSPTTFMSLHGVGTQIWLAWYWCQGLKKYPSTMGFGLG